MSETTTPARFALDEERTAAWLAGEMATYTKWSDSGDGEPGELEVGSDYDPRNAWDGEAVAHDTQSLMYYARCNGFITGPGTVEFDYVNDGDAGYVWLVYLDGPGSLKLSTYYAKLKNLGDGGEPGAEAALGVLRDAVASANELLDDLAAYVAPAAPEAQPSELRRMIAAAGGRSTSHTHEIHVICEVAVRAGLVWQCPVSDARGCGYLNDLDAAVCASCARPREAGTAP